uniref:Uncharacterized protein n=1 Tax=Oryza barthii TaxID=65489 RepID=A0A0D3FJA3_9ORYZ
MEAAAAVTRLSFVPLAAAARPLLAGFMRPRVFASISSSSSSPFSGGGGGRFFGGGGGRGRGGGGGGGGEESGAGAAAAASAAAAVVLGETETADADVILLRVGPEVTSATVDFEKKTAAVWTTPEAKATKDWRKQLGEKLSHHLSTCGFQSHVLGSWCHSPQMKKNLILDLNSENPCSFTIRGFLRAVPTYLPLWKLYIVSEKPLTTTRPRDYAQILIQEIEKFLLDLRFKYRSRIRSLYIVTTDINEHILSIMKADEFATEFI